METIPQITNFGCGAACVAMLCDVPIKTAEDAFGSVNWASHGVDEALLKNVFASFGFDMHAAAAIQMDRSSLLDIQDDCLLWGPIIELLNAPKWIANAHWAELVFRTHRLQRMRNFKDECELSIATNDHWAVWDGKAKTVRDPLGYRAMFMPTLSYRITKL